MKVFLTSSFNNYHEENGRKIAQPIDNKNGFADQLKEVGGNAKKIVFVASDPFAFEQIEEYSNILFESLKLSGLTFEEYYCLDAKNRNQAAEIIGECDIVFLSGGDTLSEMQFFEKINLRELLKDYEGIIIGQSAGAINLAKEVYNSPEHPEELTRPANFPGLDKTSLNVEPHFIFDISALSQDELFQRGHVIEESFTRPIYGICDGTHIFDDGSTQTMYGEGYLIECGKVIKLCEDGQKLSIKEASRQL